MSLQNGILAIQGNQTGLPQGSAAIGPFTIPLSGVGETIACPSNATTTVAVPTALSGGTVKPICVILTANATAAMTCSAGFITNQLTRISPLGYPTVWTFDDASVPTSVFVMVSNTVGAVVFVQFA